MNDQATISIEMPCSVASKPDRATLVWLVLATSFAVWLTRSLTTSDLIMGLVVVAVIGVFVSFQIGILRSWVKLRSEHWIRMSGDDVSVTRQVDGVSCVLARTSIQRLTVLSVKPLTIRFPWVYVGLRIASLTVDLKPLDDHQRESVVGLLGRTGGAQQRPERDK